MKLLVFVLNKTEKLDELMIKLSERGIKGATIINSRGMARALYNHEESPLIGSLRALLDPNREENNTIFTVATEEEAKIFTETVVEVIGDLSKPDTGIIFTVPVDSVEGISK